MKINSLATQNFGMAKISGDLYKKISEKHGVKVAEEICSIIKNSGSKNTTVSDFFCKGEKNDIAAIRFPQKYSASVYLVNITPGEPVAANIKKAENKFFDEVILNAFIEGNLRRKLFTLTKDFPERQDYIQKIHKNVDNEIRNQEEMNAIKLKKY